MAKNALLLTFIIFGIKGIGGNLIPEDIDNDCVIFPVVESIAPVVLPYWEDWTQKNDLDKFEEKINEKIEKAKEKLEDAKEKVEDAL
jgi:hypothetical protein